jgi:hypothetical protein
MWGEEGKRSGGKTCFSESGTNNRDGEEGTFYYCTSLAAKILKRYFPHLNSGKLSQCTVKEHYCLRLVQSRFGLAQRMLEDVDRRVLTVKGAQAPSSSLRLLEKNIRIILVKNIEY